jgi:hypothetical protein
VKERVGNKIKYVIFLLETFMIFGLTTFTSYADGDLGDLNWLTTEGNTTFDSAKNSVKGIFSSAYGLFMVASGGILVFCTILAGITYASGRRSSKDEAQDKLLGVFIGGMIIFGAVSLISAIAGMATGAFSS